MDDEVARAAREQGLDHLLEKFPDEVARAHALATEQRRQLSHSPLAATDEP